MSIGWLVGVGSGVRASRVWRLKAAVGLWRALSGMWLLVRAFGRRL
jgi:hypothetical protein